MLLFWKTKEADSSFYHVAGLACAREMGQNEAYNLQICNCLHRSRGKVHPHVDYNLMSVGLLQPGASTSCMYHSRSTDSIPTHLLSC